MTMPTTPYRVRKHCCCGTLCNFGGYFRKQISANISPSPTSSPGCRAACSTSDTLREIGRPDIIAGKREPHSESQTTSVEVRSTLPGRLKAWSCSMREPACGGGWLCVVPGLCSPASSPVSGSAPSSKSTLTPAVNGSSCEGEAPMLWKATKWAAKSPRPWSSQSFLPFSACILPRLVAREPCAARPQNRIGEPHGTSSFGDDASGRPSRSLTPRFAAISSGPKATAAAEAASAAACASAAAEAAAAAAFLGGRDGLLQSP